MTDNSWNVQVGEASRPDNPGIPPVPTTVFDGDESGAKAAYAEATSNATELDYRYVLLRHAAEIVECWGTPPAVG